jgi:leader peptidase (prepilin peptidase) / N-methyltransferase
MSDHALSVPRVTVPVLPVAVATAACAGLALARFGATGEGVVVSAFLAVLVVLSAIDLRERRLPNRIVLPGAAVALLAQTVVMPDRWLEWVASAVLAATALLVAALINPRGLGMGDVKLALLLGAVLGAAVLPALLLGFLLTVPVAAVLFLRHGAAARKATLPLGPFLAAGAAAILLLGGPRDERTTVSAQSAADVSAHATGEGR